MKALPVIVSLTLVGFACGDEDRPPRQPSDEPLVIYEHGGGVASQPRRLLVERDGEATLSVLTGTRTSERRFTLTDEQLTDLEDELGAARDEPVPTAPTSCSDCFTFTVEADGIDADLDQVSIEEVGDDLRRLVETLETLSEP